MIWLIAYLCGMPVSMLAVARYFIWPDVLERKGVWQGGDYGWVLFMGVAWPVTAFAFGLYSLVRGVQVVSRPPSVRRVEAQQVLDDQVAESERLADRAEAELRRANRDLGRVIQAALKTGMELADEVTPESGVWKCAECGGVIPGDQPSLIREHQMVGHPTPDQWGMYHCPLCVYKLSTQGSLRNHFGMYHMP